MGAFAGRRAPLCCSAPLAHIHFLQADRGHHEEDEFGKWFSAPAGAAPATGGVGKYLQKAAGGSGSGGGGAEGETAAAAMAPAAKKAKTGPSYGNFDAW